MAATDKVGPLDRALGLILRLHEMRPAPSLPERLDELFEELSHPVTTSLVTSVEGMIWALWCSHSDPVAARRMEQVIAAIAQNRYAVAERILDGLVETHPDWAEAWNKRATLYFLMDRDDESVADIEATLRLEPRHFGALSGFGQICLRHDEPVTARLAFERALAINPHLEGMRAVIDELSEAPRPTVN